MATQPPYSGQPGEQPSYTPPPAPPAPPPAYTTPTYTTPTDPGVSQPQTFEAPPMTSTAGTPPPSGGKRKFNCWIACGIVLLLLCCCCGGTVVWIIRTGADAIRTIGSVLGPEFERAMEEVMREIEREGGVTFGGDWSTDEEPWDGSDPWGDPDPWAEDGDEMGSPPDWEPDSDSSADVSSGDAVDPEAFGLWMGRKAMEGYTFDTETSFSSQTNTSLLTYILKKAGSPDERYVFSVSMTGQFIPENDAAKRLARELR